MLKIKKSGDQVARDHLRAVLFRKPAKAIYSWEALVELGNNEQSAREQLLAFKIKEAADSKGVDPGRFTVWKAPFRLAKAGPILQRAPAEGSAYSDEEEQQLIQILEEGADKSRPLNAAAATEPGLVGSWKLVRLDDIAANGTVTHPYGEPPLGYFVYDATGHLSVHIMRNPPPPPFAAGAADPTDAEKLAAWDAYAAYFGTWRADQANQVLHHMVEGGWNPSWVNTDQVRPYTLSGDTLIIDLTDPATGTRYTRELRRVG